MPDQPEEVGSYQRRSVLGLRILSRSRILQTSKLPNQVTMWAFACVGCVALIAVVSAAPAVKTAAKQSEVIGPALNVSAILHIDNGINFCNLIGGPTFFET